ncbi:MAG: hypothetical protein AB7I04_06205 [Pseudomonadales bacterium]
MLTAAAISTPAAYAAQATVTVDVDLPTVLVMYHYSNIELDLDQAALAGYLVGGTATACASDFCNDQGTSTPIPVTTMAGANTVAVTLNDPGLTNTTATFTLTNAVGVRALGCSTYEANYTDGTSDAGVTITDSAVNNIDGLGCSLTMRTGDLAFDLDFNAIAAGTDPVSAVFNVTIAGL